VRADELRRIWRQFFTEHEHVTVPSASLIPTHPTAPLFTNSGMMQFVPYFLKEEEPPYRRAESIQKCVRLAGKHNDLDELGRTRRHLSFFEMLGNWSFGDYFKEDAIRWAWELVVERVGLDGDRIWATVHDTDDESEAIWHEVIGLPMARIQRMGDKDNFWEMGATGPCGPCSEIHYDAGPQWGEEGGPKHGGGDRYIEFWNLVFMSMFRAEDGSLSDLPERNVDTGAGLERWLMLLDGVPTVFDTDAVRPLIEVVESVSGKRYGADDRLDVPMRVVADHARTMSFLVADGVVPTNEDRGYVLRSVIRRAITRGQQLGIDRPFLTDVVQRTIDHMGSAYPELVDQADHTLATIEREEGRFRQTLAAGSALLEQELAKGVVDGEAAFKLHDTYGFPIEITEEIAADRGITVDRAGFDVAMDQQRQRAKGARKSNVIDREVLETYRSIVEEHGTTEFTGRAEHESKATVLAVLSDTDDGTVDVFLDRTPFYAEAGGQIGDTGRISTPTGVVEVSDTTYALPGLHRHTGRIVEGEVVEGQEATAAIDGERRDAIRRNHTGTHLLHWALREVLGSHVKQQGSLVAPDYLRFDFSHHEAVTPEQLAAIEDLANLEVLANESVRHYETTREHAAELGAIAFFGDKYGEVVRVLEAGRHSVELCGGTHVRATGDIGPIKILSEGSIGANQRRIFASTGTGTLERIRQEEERLARVAALVGTTPEEVVDGVERLRDQLRSVQDEVKALKRQAAGAGADELVRDAVDGVVVARLDGLDRDGLRELAVTVRDKGARAVVLIGEPDTGGVALVAVTRKDAGLDAKALLQDAARAVGGGGGGKPDLATAGGKDASQIDVAVDLARAAAGLPAAGA
jgi:alanyl-tRNA synthetase